MKIILLNLLVALLLLTGLLTHSTQVIAQPQTNSLIKQIKGRLIGYLPGWKKNIPSAASLSEAGYTHIVIAFAVFDTRKPGKLTPAFDTISKEYIKSLHHEGIKVLLSIGGPDTSIPHTEVNFHKVVIASSSPTVFQKNFVKSLEHFIDSHGFDGFDIDIEQGFQAEGDFSKPVGDILILANIINLMHAKHPNLLISLAPQVENIAATPSFNAIWGNYASLIMQTHNSLSWVGLQIYSIGCTFGIDHVCYDPKDTSTPDFSVAMVTNLLTDWPSKTKTGETTGFQHYISYLSPSQIVLGYAVPNAKDDLPIVPFTIIKRAMQCLKTGVSSSTSCGNFIPPKAYPGIGGVFGWEVLFDHNSGFIFASTLKKCAINSYCE